MRIGSEAGMVAVGMAAAIWPGEAAGAQQGSRGLLFEPAPKAGQLPEEPRAFPLRPRPTTAIAVHDFNGDGHLDLLWGRDRTSDTLWWGRGNNRFEAAGGGEWPYSDRSTIGVTVGDTDGDGDLDLILTEVLGPMRHLTNLGQGFTETTAQRFPSLTALPSKAELVDLDGDGVLELVMVGSFQAARVWSQDPMGKFRDSSPVWLWGPSVFTNALAIEDLDGDGYPDAILGNRVFLNSGSSLVEKQMLPSVQATWIRDHKLADFNGDGHMDLITATTAGADVLFLGNGAGGLAEAPSDALPPLPTQSLAIGAADVDGDGDVDIVQGTYGEADKLLLNDGSGRFTRHSEPGWDRVLNSTDTQSIAFQDINGDGWIDLLMGRGHHTSVGTRDRVLLLGPRDPADLNATRAQTVGGSPRRITAGDLDGDGDPDVVVAHGNGDMDILWNHGGSFAADVGDLQLRGSDPHLIDLDQDGRDELLCQTSSGSVMVRGYDGAADPVAAAWTTAATTVPNQTPGLVVVDCNGDGLADLVRTRRTGANTTPIQFGVALATGPNTFGPMVWERALAFGDGTTLVPVDADSDQLPDLAAMSIDGTLSIVRRSAAGFTHATVATPPGNQGFALAVGDLNGDGRPDLFAGRGSQDQVLLGDGNGGFQVSLAATAQVPQQPTYHVALGDVDGDGDLDVVRSHSYLATMDILENDGAGNLSPIAPGMLPPTMMQSYCTLLLDADMDGDLDLLNVAPDFTELWLNRTVQLLSDGMPVAGQPIDIELSVHPAQPADLAIVVLMIGRPGAPRTLPLIEGGLRLEAADMLTQALEVMQHEDRRVWTLQVPTGWAGGLGIDLAVQGAVWEPMSSKPIRFTNLETKPLIR